MIVVYRIEHAETHVGPYQTPSVRAHPRWMASRAWRAYVRRYTAQHKGHPVVDIPDMTPELMASGRMLYGFIDLDHYHAWFKPAILGWLRRRGFVLARYEATHVMVGTLHVAFVGERIDHSTL